MVGTSASAPRPGRVSTMLRGLVLGALAGGGWWIAEMVVHWSAGSLLPTEVVAQLAAADIGIAAAAGLVLGLAFPGLGDVGLAFALAGAYGLLRVWEPPGMGAEACFVLLAAGAVWLGRRVVAEPRGGVLALVHVVLLACVALLLLDLAIAESHAASAPGPWLLLVLAALPVAAAGVDRVLGFAVRRRGRRLVLELAVGLAVAWVFGRPLSTAPLSTPLVTHVPPPAGTPDVIILSLDTTRADHLSTYGYARETTPNLTAFAADALLFENARSTDGWTLPSHASMLTGLYPSKHGARAAGGWLAGQSIDGRRNVAFPLGPDKITLAELLRDRGYNTGAFIGNFSYLYRDFGLSQGFQIYDDAPGLLLRLRSPAIRFLQTFIRHFCLKPYRSADKVNANAIRWLDSLSPDRPVFLFLNYMDAHPPWLADAPFDGWAESQPSARILAAENLYTHAIRDFTEQERDFIVANYDGQLSGSDRNLGALMAALKARGHFDNALVIVTADHGTLLGEHEQVGHIGRMLYEPLLHVPLVVKFPGPNHPRGRVSTPVQLIDVFSTAVAVAGATAPAAAQGQALPDVTHPVLAEEDINAYLVSNYGKLYDRAVRVLVDGKDKLIATSRGERMLYDLATDPGEQRNRAAEEPERTEALAKELSRLLPFPGSEHAAAGGPPGSAQ